MRCIHHWRIEAPNGPTCRGWCKLCGDEKDFSTSNDKFFYGNRAMHTMKISNSGRDALGPLRIEEGYKE